MVILYILYLADQEFYSVKRISGCSFQITGTMDVEPPDKSIPDFLSALTDNQTHLVLIHLLRSNPFLVEEATTFARDLISGIDEV